MPRIVVAKEELQTWLTTEIRKVEGCEECSFGGIVRLRESDEFGCNWSDDIVLRATDVPPEIYKPAATKVMVEARSKFNIA